MSRLLLLIAPPMDAGLLDSIAVFCIESGELHASAGRSMGREGQWRWRMWRVGHLDIVASCADDLRLRMQCNEVQYFPRDSVEAMVHVG